MTSTRDVQHRVQPGAAGEPAAPHVIRLPSPRRLLRPLPTLVLLALLVGTASAPQGPDQAATGRPGRAPAAQASVTAPGASPWYEEVVRRDPPGAGVGTSAVQDRTPVLLPMAPAALESPAAASGTAVDVRAELWAAYRHAAAAVPATCHLDPRLLAAIGQVESGSLAGRGLDAGHRAVPPVLGPVLDGAGYARIADTDGGRLDGDPVWDRAVGPMQFIPSTWARWGRDADGDGVADPQDVEDAALSAAAYLCVGGRDLADPSGLRAAVLSYNHSDAYVAMVLGLLPRMAPGAPGSVLGAVAPAVWTAAATVEPSVVQPPPSRTVPTPSTPTRTAGPTRTAAAGPTTTTAGPTTEGPAAASSTTSTSTTSPTSTTVVTTSAPASSTTTATSSPTTTEPASPTTTAPSSTTTTASATSTSTPHGCASGSTTAAAAGTASPAATTTTSGGTEPAAQTPASTDPSGTCTTNPTATATTPVPSTSSATAAEATLLGEAGTAG